MGRTLCCSALLTVDWSAHCPVRPGATDWGRSGEQGGGAAGGMLAATADEEELIEELGRQIEQRQRQLLELGKRKNEVGDVWL